MRNWKEQFADKVSRSSCYVEELCGNRPCFVQANLGLGDGTRGFTALKPPKDLVLFDEFQCEDDDVSVSSSNSEESSESFSLNLSGGRDEAANTSSSSRQILADEYVFLTEERGSFSLQTGAPSVSQGEATGREEGQWGGATGAKVVEGGRELQSKEDRQQDMSIPADFAVHQSDRTPSYRAEGAVGGSARERRRQALPAAWRKGERLPHVMEAIRVNKENVNNNDREFAIPADVSVSAVPKDKGQAGGQQDGVARRLFSSLIEGERNVHVAVGSWSRESRGESSIPMDVQESAETIHHNLTLPSWPKEEWTGPTNEVGMKVGREGRSSRERAGNGFSRSSSSPSEVSFLDEIKSFLDRYRSDSQEERQLYSSHDSPRFLPAANVVGTSSLPSEGEEELELDVDGLILADLSISQDASLRLVTEQPAASAFSPPASSSAAGAGRQPEPHMVEAEDGRAEPPPRPPRPSRSRCCLVDAPAPDPDKQESTVMV
ncbi:hypothetical protein GUITHDRAFT_105440 [Guillardia theta CCMP2712]|uniref:Uncharacterized protein n=1 Tax=Guillardia theta (strain CCMP2712) TaxID=905079 RepID=L1JL05_GUITC|nr:hypothetical protein GUITHDRAFT_105440 [Guillardia theta CCMP2712]EKX48814.1 hypothetical protein GUITHDRAFT_105440 [Guillardia theta CCMP2712]|eukprot:XP_005835794.1 hypothetical protein GUITHDRAFT_105440 [Guillardia theta CCMP2712]